MLRDAQTEYELRRRDRFFKQIYESSEDCIKILTLEGRLVAMSERGQRLLEIPDISALLHSDWVGFWNDGDKVAAQDAVDTARGGGVGSFTGSFATDTGTPKWWSVVVTQIAGDGGDPEYLLSVSRDVTALVRAREAVQEGYDREYHLLLQLQRAMLPQNLPETGSLQFEAVYIPGTPNAAIGGDWYDAFSLREGRTFVSVGDVCGHSLDAAIVMGHVRQNIRAFALDNDAPIEILKRANEALCLQHPDTFVTAWLGVIEAGVLTYASAGHVPPLLQRKGGSVESLEGSVVPLGVTDSSLWRGAADTALRIDDARLLALYTDGLVRTLDMTEGEAALRGFLESAGDHSAKSIEQALLGDRHDDDIAILTVRFP